MSGSRAQSLAAVLLPQRRQFPIQLSLCIAATAFSKWYVDKFPLTGWEEVSQALGLRPLYNITVQVFGICWTSFFSVSLIKFFMLTALKKIYFLEEIAQQCKAVCSQNVFFCMVFLTGSLSLFPQPFAVTGILPVKPDACKQCLATAWCPRKIRT